MTQQLQPIDLVAPGFFGLNLQQASSLLGPQYAVRANNAFIDDSGRLAARDGFVPLGPALAADNPVRSVFEYLTSTGGSETIVGFDGGIANDPADVAGSSIAGSVPTANGKWWFQNFNNKVVGFVDGETPIVYDGTGTFTTIVPSSGTVPTSRGGIGLSAYGRIWALDSDGSTIRYTGLLDETDWGGEGAGLIDMHNVWVDGTDEVTAIEAFNGALVVFGRRQIIIWTDGQGFELGLDPDFISVVDTIQGVGCLTQWSLQDVGETDLLFLSRNGIQSLARLVIDRSNPVSNLTKTVRDALMNQVSDSDLDLVSSAYSPEEGFYLLTLPDQQTTWVLDQRRRYSDQDGDTLSIVTQWDLAPYAWNVQEDGLILLGNEFAVARYDSAADNGESFRFEYESPWLDLGERTANLLKLLKRYGAILFVTNFTNVELCWATDFDLDFESIECPITGGGPDSEYGTAEFGIGEFGGGLALRVVQVPARDTGQYYKLAVEADVTGEFAIQQLELFTKIGRLA